jgi:hypothetical protein
MNRLLAFALLAGALGGCVHSRDPLYSWGDYEDVVYGSYASPDKFPPQAQVGILEQNYQEARADNRRMPPGWHAHLGYLYYQLGKADQARQELMTEKAQFPESAVLMDRLLVNLKKQ